MVQLYRKRLHQGSVYSESCYHGEEGPLIGGCRELQDMMASPSGSRDAHVDEAPSEAIFTVLCFYMIRLADRAEGHGKL